MFGSGLPWVIDKSVVGDGALRIRTRIFLASSHPGWPEPDCQRWSWRLSFHSGPTCLSRFADRPPCSERTSIEKINVPGLKCISEFRNRPPTPRSRSMPQSAEPVGGYLCGRYEESGAYSSRFPESLCYRNENLAQRHRFDSDALCGRKNGADLLPGLLIIKTRFHKPNDRRRCFNS
jgi:hypothetical protein